MNENEPKIEVEIVDDTKTKKEIGRTPEEVLSILEQAIESESEVDIMVKNLCDHHYRNKIVIPNKIENGVLHLTTKDGYKMEIELSRIIGAKSI